MKKTLVILPIILALTSIFGCSKEQCEDVKEENQKVLFSDEYRRNESCHWHPSLDGSNVVSGLAEHYFVDGICVCGATKNVKVEEVKICDSSILYINYLESTKDKLLDELIPPSIKSSDIYGVVLTMIDGIESSCIGNGTITYRRYNFVYPSRYFDGTPIMLSGCFTIPYLNGKIKAKSISITSHQTFTDLSEAPTKGFDMLVTPALTGSVVIEFDLVGFGITSDLPMDYHCRHLSSRNTIDGVLAAYSILENEFGINQKDLKVYNVGYSQGGYDSLALLRYLEQDASEKEKEIIHINRTMSGSGAYDPLLMFDTSLANDKFDAPEFLLLAIMSGFSFHADKLEGFTYDDFLTDYGKEFIEPLTLKSASKLSLVKEKTDNKGQYIYTGPHSFFKEELFNKESNIHKAITNAVEEENLLDGKWVPEGKVNLFYSEDDKTVTPNCTLKAQEVFSSKIGQNIKIGTITGDHGTAAVYYYIEVINQLKLDTK